MSDDAYRIVTEPDWLEPFNISQGFRQGNMLYLSGQAAIDPEGNVVGENNFDAQADQVFQNLKTVLEAGGSSLDQVLRVTIYLTDMEHFPRIVELRENYFSRPYPADTLVEVRSLALPELMIEIDAIALRDGQVLE